MKHLFLFFEGFLNGSFFFDGAVERVTWNGSVSSRTICGRRRTTYKSNDKYVYQNKSI